MFIHYLQVRVNREEEFLYIILLELLFLGTFSLITEEKKVPYCRCMMLPSMALTVRWQ